MHNQHFIGKEIIYLKDSAVSIFTDDFPEEQDENNFAYCPPNGNYGTIESYPWKCRNGPSGEPRVKAPYFSNPKVCHEGVPTGDVYNNNADFISKSKFKIQNVGSNCLDGNPTSEWKMKSNCNSDEKVFDPPINKLKGI